MHWSNAAVYGKDAGAVVAAVLAVVSTWKGLSDLTGRGRARAQLSAEVGVWEKLPDDSFERGVMWHLVERSVARLADLEDPARRRERRRAGFLLLLFAAVLVGASIWILLSEGTAGLVRTVALAVTGIAVSTFVERRSKRAEAEAATEQQVERTSTDDGRCRGPGSAAREAPLGRLAHGEGSRIGLTSYHLYANRVSQEVSATTRSWTFTTLHSGWTYKLYVSARNAKGRSIEATVLVNVLPAITRYADCAALNWVYPHGVGRSSTVVDHTSATRVGGFYVSRALYDLNPARDRDKDGIACEKL